MHTFHNNVKAQYAFIVAFIFSCVFSSICQQDIFSINGTYTTSLSDALSYQFNIYSYVHLFFLPVFIFISFYLLKTCKFDELIITRFQNRNRYFMYRETKAILITLGYRLIEVVSSTIIFTLSSKINSQHPFSLSFSLAVQKVLCITPQNFKETLVIFIYVQLVLLLLYFFFSQIIILSDLSLRNPFVASSIPILINFFLLILIKSDYLFGNSFFDWILPHRNIYLEYIFGFKNAFRLGLILRALFYWVFIIAILGIIIFLEMKRKDYMFSSEKTE